MSKEKLIKKIGISVGGLKGLVLEGTVESVKENKIAINGFKDTVKHPIHVALEAGIGDLRFAVLEICGLLQDTTNKNVRASLLSNCEILAIEFQLGDTPWFKIKASSRVFDEKFHTICTPKVDEEDGYEHFKTVINIIKVILEEIGHYVNKTKVISDEELMESFVKHGKGKSLDREAMENMSAEERSEWLHSELGKMGFIVNSVHMDDLVKEEDTEIVDLETTTDSSEIVFDEAEKEEIEFLNVANESKDSLEIDSISQEQVLELKIAEPVKVKK